MTRCPVWLHFAVSSALIASSGAAAAPPNKCVLNGTVTFQQGPCPSDHVRKQPTVEELNAQEKKRRAATLAANPAAVASAVPGKAPDAFGCDGRTYCSQMRSCAEAKYFLAHCPGVKMDGDRNGIPCEQQWCGH
ncbi:MAG: excalibur calcium-binding domain-containing protein [Proteobacteria bacterium]|nr:excalibur calcium-binding domain-containing protein [Pseudomonadota bacterium]